MVPLGSSTRWTKPIGHKVNAFESCIEVYLSIVGFLENSASLVAK